MKSESGQWITTSTTDGSNGRRNSSHGPWLVDRADWSAASSRRLSFSSSDDMLSVHSAFPSCLQLATRHARPPCSHLVNPSSPGAARPPALHARCLAGGGRDPSIAMPRATKPGRPVPGGAGHWLGISQPRCPPAVSAQRWFMCIGSLDEHTEANTLSACLCIIYLGKAKVTGLLRNGQSPIGSV